MSDFLNNGITLADACCNLLDVQWTGAVKIAHSNIG